jgi:putative NADPH-quinone reductase
MCWCIKEWFDNVFEAQRKDKKVEPLFAAYQQKKWQPRDRAAICTTKMRNNQISD